MNGRMYYMKNIHIGDLILKGVRSGSVLIPDSDAKLTRDPDLQDQWFLERIQILLAQQC